MSTYLIYSVLVLATTASFFGTFCAITYCQKVEQEKEAMKTSKAETLARKNALLLEQEKAKIYLHNMDNEEFKRREMRQNLGVAEPGEFIVELQPIN
ncbi:MAG: hypothetical protein LBD01_05665 [Puniceicoccales bacterium]|nr:hypothetical protein [Puniceicoccales bacterium]